MDIQVPFLARRGGEAPTSPNSIGPDRLLVWEWEEGLARSGGLLTAEPGRPNWQKPWPPERAVVMVENLRQVSRRAVRDPANARDFRSTAP